MSYPLVYNKKHGVPFDLKVIKEKMFYTLIMGENDGLFLFYIDVIDGCEVRGYHSYMPRFKHQDMLYRAYAMRNVFESEVKGSRRDIAIYNEEYSTEYSYGRSVFTYDSIPDIEGDFYFCEFYLNQGLSLQEPTLPMKKKM